MRLSEDLRARGLIKDTTFDDPSWLDTPRTFYLGADCQSADSLTIGNLAVFLLAKRLANAGWRPVLLVGGATSLIGDPGGKDDERELTSREQIVHNVAGIKAQVERLFAGIEFTLVDNYDWFKDMGYLEFLRDVGKHFSMTELVQRDFIANRMGADGSGISYAEFSYNLIQGYDYYHLNQAFGVELQIGGSDQWGNMLSGVPFIRKKTGKEAHALSMPLIINKATGKKFGKSESGAVWLDAAKTSIGQFRQFWINADDAGVEDYLKVYTEYSLEEIAGIMQDHRRDPSKRIAQTALADAVTAVVHGTARSNDETGVEQIIQDQRIPEDIDPDTLTAFRANFGSAAVTAGSSVVDALAATGLAASKSEARRLVQSGAVYVNGMQVKREVFEPDDFANGRLLLRRGKKFKDSAIVELNA